MTSLAAPTVDRRVPTSSRTRRLSATGTVGNQPAGTRVSRRMELAIPYRCGRGHGRGRIGFVAARRLASDGRG